MKLSPQRDSPARRRALALGLACSLLAASAAAAEPGPAPSAAPGDAAKEDAGGAFRAFIDGERAFRGGDFLQAARHFEEAYRLTPHPDALWNAAQAWDRAGEAARAANLYERYLAEAPAGSRDRDSALQGLNRLAAKLGRIDVVAPGLTRVLVDEQAIVGSRVYVTPGAHTIRGEAGAQRLARTTSVAAGEAVSVALVEEVGAPDVKASPSAPPPFALPPPAAAPVLLVGWQRGVVAAGFAATLISGGILIWSGVETLQARLAFAREGGTPQALLDGRDLQTRTNVLVGTTVGLGAATIASAVLFATVGRTPVEARVGAAVDPSGVPLPSISLRGRF